MKVVDITPSFQETVTDRELRLKEDFSKYTILVFVASNALVLFMICIIYFTSTENSIITKEVVMALIGATTVQVGSIMLLMGKHYFK